MIDASISAPNAPLFELTHFLEGQTTAWGVFEDRFRKLRRRFTVEMNGHWQDRVFLLEERFIYDTGEVETRTWRIVPSSGGRFSATCSDCVGEARGHCTNDSVHMSYRFRLMLDKRSMVVDFDDRMYRMTDGTAVNRATMSKWGVKLGELSLFFQRSIASGATTKPHLAA
jgi:Protein of unknown function (DUF3833)